MRILWYLLVALVLIVLQSMLFRLRGLKRIRYTRYFNTDACLEGEEVLMVEQVLNRSFMPLPWLRMESQIHANLKFNRQANLDVSEGREYQNHRSLFTMMPWSRITRRHTIRCLKRGLYNLDSVTMSTGDVLGLYETHQKMQVEAELAVYPKALDWEEVQLPSHSWQGDVVVRRWILSDPFMISGVREYRPGDPLKSVNWKATARAGSMLVHNHDFTADHRLIIGVNTEVSEDMWKAVTDPELVEQQIRYAAAIAEYALSQGMETGFICNGYALGEAKDKPVRVEAAAGDSHLEAILHAMASIVVARALPFDTLLEQEVQAGRSNLDFVLITPFVSDKIERQIQALRNRDNAVEILELPTYHRPTKDESDSMAAEGVKAHD